MRQTELKIQTKGKGLYQITEPILEQIGSDLPEIGVLNIFLQHTSASLIIQENADPTAKRDLEEFLDRLVQDDQSWHQHTLEGSDDTTSHMKSVITSPFLQIPIKGSKLALGTWQGIYLWEHRKAHHQRKVILTLLSST